ncbi:MAG TPA: hypothetical protein VMU84_05150 [Thermoanaerobaculia bacterium]|nr:hypothetical protein [Thermoanaerobaculia bacterium]
MTAAVRVRSYTGPACPRCAKPLNHADLHDGDAICPYCKHPFETRVFQPRQRDNAVLQLAQSGPEEGTPCAYHARNAAVASCERCGVFICSLCEMAIDAGKFCPSCFDRMAQEQAGGATQTRIRDYGSLAMLSALAGLLIAVFLGIPGAIMSWYYAIKAWRHPENSSLGRTRLIIVMLVGAGDFAIGVFMLYAFITAFTRK